MAKQIVSLEPHSSQAFSSAFSLESPSTIDSEKIPSLSLSHLSLNNRPLSHSSFSHHSPSQLSLSHLPLSHIPLSHLPLSHIPRAKQLELEKAVEIILASMIKKERPKMLILFGSYARGDWVESLTDDGMSYHYQSCFDVLAVMKNAALVRKIERKTSLHKRLKREVATPVHLIAEDAYDVNNRISQGVRFYSDMVDDGIVLYDTGKFSLSQVQEPDVFVLSPVARKRQAEADFVHWFGKADILMTLFHFCMAGENYREASFQLHQATECLYNAILLVLSGYKPRTHDLHVLSQRVASVEPAFLRIFPQGREEEKTKFERLRKAYIHSRYQRQFTVTKDHLDWLAARVQQLQTLTKIRCQARMASDKI